MEFGGDEVDRDMGSLASQEDRARDRRRIKEFREKTNPSSIGNAHVFSSSESGRETERAKNLSAKEKYPRLPKMTRKLSTGSEIDSVLMDRYRSGQNIFAAMNGPSIPEFLRHPNKLENSFRNAFTYLETYSGVLENWAAQKDIIDRIKLQSNRRYSSRISDSEKLFLAQKIKNDVAHCVNQIPSVYFDPEFQVNDPEFFRPLTESQHFAVLQEKLSYYLDLIEINILSYIRYHSEAFFDALCSIQDLYVKISFMCILLQKSRKKIKELQNDVTLKPLRLLRDVRKYTNLLRLSELIGKISTVYNSMQTINALISSGDFSYAIDLILIVENSINTELKDSVALTKLPMKLEDLKKTLVLLLENDLSNLILAETYVSELSEYDCRLYSFLKSLFRLHQASIFMTTYISSFRSVIKSNVESFLSKYLENNVPLLLPDNFEILLKSDSKSEKDELSTSFLGFSSVAFHSLIVDIKGLIGKAELRIEHDRCFIMQKCASENCDFGLGNFFQDCLVDMNSTILNLVMFLLKIRPLNFGCQSIYEARDLLQTCYSATDDAESLSKRTFYDIRSFLLNESKAFFSAIHEKSINKLNDCLQSEKWIEVRSPARYQKLIDKRFLLIHLQHEVPENGCQSSESTTTETSITYEKLSAVRSLWWDSDLSGSKPDDTYESVSDCDHLIINDEKFKVVDSILRLLDVISSYVEAAVLLSPVTSEVIHKLVQILSIFGSRTCQLILGAGAMHSAGLKSITARHLAIASQCLSLIMSVVPIISSELSSRLPAKHHLLLKEFDRVTRDCENYRSEIFSKLIKIMEELIQGYFVKLVKDLQSYFRVPNNGQSAPPQASASVQAKVFQNNEVHPSIKNSTRQLRQLHKILTSMMTPSQRQEILYRVAECFGSTLNRYLGHLSIEKHSEEKKIKEFISEQVNFILRLLESLKIENPKAFKGLRKWSLKSIPHGVDVILEQND